MKLVKANSDRLGDPDHLAKIMATDPYFITQDNGAGAPLHFATTYKQLDMSRGADPTIRTENYDPYLSPGKKMPIDVALDDDEVRSKLRALDKQYAKVKKVREPHPDIGCWWTLYDYGLDAVKKWDKNYKHPYPEEIKRAKDEVEHKKMKEERRKKKALQAAGDAGKPAAQSGPEAAAVAAPAKAQVPDTPVAFLFPGQGSQAVGMLKECKDIPAVKKMLATAESVLGYDLLKLCLEGPKEKLDDTVYSQPALFVAGLAAVEKLRAEDPKLVDSCSAAAGLSLGEYCALVFAGALSFEDGLKVVKRRGESMAAAAKQGKPHGMLSIIGLGDAVLEDVCAKARAKLGGDTVCRIANYLFPTGRVASGHKDALAEVATLATAAGPMKAVPLAVSGAFHTPLMQPAREALIEVLGSVSFAEPRMPVYSNVTGAPFGAAEEIPGMLARQLVEPVQWERTLTALVKDAGKSQLAELGPGAQIKAMVKRVDMGVWKAMKNVSV
ncbi:Malonyl CoA-acyl carrier protein transacylase [Coccomyxa sp. Obi]|nr:Malonyl CoA-acyl carrier protein transacylase [Coccomyxa sp. Obi]